jgi:histidyl-tRNA synthetase
MKDVLPTEVGGWQLLEGTARELLAAYGYAEMRVPIVEHTELFKRAIGEYTDVVEKEMYTFIDQGRDEGGVSLTLRPEATAGMVRAAISNGMLRGARHKLWCIGPMFRHERPQKGRYRQFHQVDVEAIGFAGPDVDAELIALTARLWQQLGIERVSLQINSLGTLESRKIYRDKLVAYFNQHRKQLDADSLRRLDGNPLRILDSKNPQLREIIARAPLITEHLDAESQMHFDTLCRSLQAMGIAYTINPRLVRGLDYYSRTVFEWITDALGSQDAVCSGGRYDGLIAQLGGEPTPAIGFAMGVERVVALLEQNQRSAPAAKAGLYLVVQGAEAELAGLQIAEQLRAAVPGRRVELNLGGGNFKAQFRRADRCGAAFAVVLGDDELARDVVQLKALRGEPKQIEIPRAELAQRVANALASFDADA